jgi:hypothetical protein
VRQQQLLTDKLEFVNNARSLVEAELRDACGTGARLWTPRLPPYSVTS